jgi:GT2 family glycosyltransferase
MTGGPTLRLTVVISTLDRPDALERCVASLVSGTRKPDEVVIVDQSRSRSAEPIVEAQRELAIRYMHQDRIGLGVSQNEGLRSANAPIAAVIDDDCVASADWLASLERAFRETPQLALVAGRVLPLGPATPGLYAVSSRTSQTRRDFRGSGLPWDVGSGNNFAVRTEWFERVGGCDEGLGPGTRARGAVDMDLFYRFLRAGALIRYEPGAVVFHEQKELRERLRRRKDYGFGTGAFVATWLRRGDREALRVLKSWTALRGRILVGDLRRGRWLGLYEEAVVLGATAGGAVYGLCRQDLADE